MKEYCLKWDLTANPTKTKVVIFGRGIMRNLPVFMYDEPIEVVVEFVYLGVKFSANGS